MLCKIKSLDRSKRNYEQLKSDEFIKNCAMGVKALTLKHLTYI